jgi:uncharacterized protein YkwD
MAFSSTDEFMELYNNPDYALFKSPRMEVSIKMVAPVSDHDLISELDKKVTDKDYIDIEKGQLHETTNQTGIFYLAKKKVKGELCAIGYVNYIENQKTCLIEMVYDIKTKEKAMQIIESFFTGSARNQATNNQAETAKPTKPEQKNIDTAGKDKKSESTENKETVGTKESSKQKANAENNTQQTTTTQAQKPIQTATQTSSEDKQPKHPKISDPNLIELSQAQIQEFLDAHNRWRSQVGVPPLTWSNDLQNFAAEWAVTQGRKDCEMEHRGNNPYGENLYWSSGMAFSPTGVVDSWGSEISDYHGEVVGQSNGVVGHYTQVVWKKTTEVGCAAYKCGSALLVVCNYNPPGNYVGQHPYK